MHSPFYKPNDRLSIFHVNSRSLSGKRIQLETALDTLHQSLIFLHLPRRGFRQSPMSIFVMVRYAKVSTEKIVEVAVDHFISKITLATLFFPNYWLLMTIMSRLL